MYSIPYHYLVWGTLPSAVRETGASRKNGGPIEDPSVSIVLWCIIGFSGALIFTPMMPRVASLTVLVFPVWLLRVSEVNGVPISSRV